MESQSKNALFCGMLELNIYNKDIISKLRFLKSADFISFTIVKDYEIMQTLMI